MRDIPRRPTADDETNSAGTTKASQDKTAPPSDTRSEDKQPVREPPRRPGSPPDVDPKDLQSLLDYRDARARAESRLVRAERLEQNDHRRASVPEPDDPSPAQPTPSGRSTTDGAPRQRDDAKTTGNPPREPLRRPGVARPVDPEDLQSLLDYRDERARQERERSGQLDRVPPSDRRRATKLESDDVEAVPSDASKLPAEPNNEPADGSSRTEPRTARRSDGPGRDKQQDGAPDPAERTRPQVSEPDETKLAALLALVHEAADGDDRPDPPSNRTRPIAEGDIDYQVVDPTSLERTITDIDVTFDGTLWEEKSATGADPRMNIEEWTKMNVTGKLDRYLEARQHVGAAYSDAPIGIVFSDPNTTGAFKQKVEALAEAWRRDHPDVEVKVWWAR